MEPTREQAHVLDSRARRQEIQARAGTGKTTLLQMIADHEKNKKKKFLYLVFNTSQRMEAKKKFGKNTNAHTVHSYGFSQGGYNFHPFGNFSPSVFFEAYEDFGTKDQMLLSGLSHQFMVYYLNAPEPSFAETIPFFEPFLSSFQAQVFNRNYQLIEKTVTELYKLWEKKDESIKSPHDFYLKYTYLNGALQKGLNRYDVLLLDEGQDLTRITLELAKNFKGEVILVGDPYQQIYSWRYAVNAMELFESEDHFKLSQSFRFGENVATTASRWIQTVRDPNFYLVGTPDVHSRVWRHNGNYDLTTGSALIHRSNIGMFGSLLDLQRRQLPYRFERDLRGVLGQIIDGYWLMMGNNQKIRDPFLQELNSFTELEEYAESMGEVSWMSIINIVKKYVHMLPGAAFDVIAEVKRQRNLPEKEKALGITLSTIHASKGCEYDKVVLGEDNVTVFKMDLDNINYAEEERLMYVAMTRVKKDLFLPDTIDEANEGSYEWREFCRSIARWSSF